MNRIKKITWILFEIAFPIFPFCRGFLDFLEPDLVISKEGWEVLEDPVKRAKVNFFIDRYKETGEWDFSIMEDESLINK